MPVTPWSLRGRLLMAALVALISGTLHSPAAWAEAPPRPNIVLLLADDLGWADLACYGNRFHDSPRLDQLARDGLRFTQFYAGPVCSPTRANLQSGQDQARLGITQHIPGHRRPFARLIDPVVPDHLPLEVETFAESLGRAGYQTGYFGKWHLGGRGFGPQEQGWQTAEETQGHVVPGNRSAPPGARSTEYLADRAIDFIHEHRSTPFLLQVSYAAVHLPLTTTPELRARYEAKPKAEGYPSLAAYAGLVSELDTSVGRIVEAIDRAGLRNNTLIVFLSDNGGLEHQQNGQIVTSNRPLRGEKGTLYEGGLRVPAIFRWPGRIAAGEVCHVPASTIDLAPTFRALAGAPLTAPQPVDGVDLAPLLAQPSAGLARARLTWHLPHYHHSQPASALREGRWKLIQWLETSRAELYDLAADPGETTDLAETYPDLTARLAQDLETWRRDVGARLPVPNPQFDPARAQELAGKRSAE